jgi:hypothetical protein
MAPNLPLDMTEQLAPILWALMATLGGGLAAITTLATERCSQPSTNVAEPPGRVETSQRPRQKMRLAKQRSAARSPLGMGKPSTVPAPS